MCMLDEISARCACRGAIRSPEVAKQRAATRSQEAAREEIYAIARAHKAEKLWVFGLCAYAAWNLVVQGKPFEKIVSGI